MEVVLLERVEKLGQMGEVVRVKDGYARNYLLPQRKALRATKDNMARFEKERAQLEATNLQRRAEAEKVAAKMTDVSVTILRNASETAALYGSVSSRDVADALTAAGYTVERSQVALDRPYKTLGMHKVRIALHPEVSIEATVNIARSQAEAEQQAAGIVPAAEQFFEEGAAPEAEAEGDAEATESKSN
ncbi:50S ribosomal protein L9 [Desertibaculum subflavum]|uniref:50S ribosomal protein L9 n=1 Tax=Desertibaculum subflavum TaxID=2268458 RepID=UPI000E6631C9